MAKIRSHGARAFRGTSLKNASRNHPVAVSAFRSSVKIIHTWRANTSSLAKHVSAFLAPIACRASCLLFDETSNTTVAVFWFLDKRITGTRHRIVCTLLPSFSVSVPIRRVINFHTFRDILLRPIQLPPQRSSSCAAKSPGTAGTISITSPRPPTPQGRG